MTGEPTLHYGDRSADGWVEYLQSLLLDIDPNLVADGVFGDRTIAAVYGHQQRQNLMVDGVVGNQTWASLRGEEPAQVGTDGNLHQQTDHGLHAVWFEDQNAHGRTGEYLESEDAVWFFVESVGDTVIPANEFKLNVNVTTPDGDLQHNELPIRGLDEGDGKPGDMMWATLEFIKAGTGSGDYRYTAELPDGLRGGMHEGSFTVPA